MKILKFFLPIIAFAFLISCATQHEGTKVPSSLSFERYLSHIKIGNEKMQSQEFEDAIVEFRAALEFNPNTVELYNLIGICYVQLRQYPLAENELLQAIGRNPSFAAAHNNLGTVYYAKGNYDEALRDFKEALRLNPQMASAYHNIANIYLAKDQADLAIDYYKQAYKINPDYIAASSTFLTSVNEFPKGKGEKEYSYACVLASLGEAEKALEYLQKAIDKGFSDWDKIHSEEDLEQLRDKPAFKKLIKKKP